MYLKKEQRGSDRTIDAIQLDDESELDRLEGLKEGNEENDGERLPSYRTDATRHCNSIVRVTRIRTL